MIISHKTLQRLPLYLSCLRQLREAGTDFVSSAQIAGALHLGAVLVRKDLAAVSSSGGSPKKGYEISGLIKDIEDILDPGDNSEAVLAGVGNLGRSLLGHSGFDACRIKIVAAFDIDPELTGIEIGGRNVYDIRRLRNFCEQLKIPVGIIAVPGEAAQDVCDIMISGGVRAIWNLSCTHLEVPEGVVLREDDLAVGLSLLALELRG